MIKVEFQHNGIKNFIQAIEEEKMRQVCNKFSQKCQIDINSLYFMYSGNIVNLDLSIAQLINKLDNERKIMSIIAIDHLNEKGNKSIITSPIIICPICKEPARFEMVDYRIKIYNCKNGHVVDNILLKEFEKTQLIDESLIVCDKCKVNNKSITYNKEMYICNACNMNLCPLCKSNHDKKHKIINYEQKFYVCKKHDKEYNSYCETCKNDICILCKKDHRLHKIISYDDVVPEKEIIGEDEIKSYLNSLRSNFNVKIELIIDRLINVKQNMEIYFKLIEKNLVNYNINTINYNILQNINYNIRDTGPFNTPYLAYLDEDYDNILRDNTYKESIPIILKMYNGMNKNEIDLIYEIQNNEKEIKILGKFFVEKYKDLCRIIYNNKEYDLTETFNCENIKDNILKIKLKGINNATDLSWMFEGCSQLSKLSNFSDWDTSYVLDMSCLFRYCKFLELPDISNWNTSNVGNMGYMFSRCSSLQSLPDISNWNTSKVENMGFMFSECSSLKSLPDISNWNTSNVGNMQCMFSECSSLQSLPDISKWNISNVLCTGCMFEDCRSLKSLPDISKWDISKAVKRGIEYPNLPVNGIKCMFDGCSESLNIPEKFKNVE